MRIRQNYWEVDAMLAFAGVVIATLAMVIGISVGKVGRPKPAAMGADGEVWTNVWVTTEDSVMLFDRLIVSTNGLMAPKGEPGERFNISEDPLEDLVDTMAGTGRWLDLPATNYYVSNRVHWIHLDSNSAQDVILRQWNRRAE